MEIDARPQEAVIASLESVKAQREIDVTYARQEADRARKLLEAGASSQMDADRAANALNAAQAQVRTVEEQIRQARTDLAYYRVTSPTAGVVADVPVRQGDRVTKATMLTTVEANEGLELYLNVPIQQAPQLKIGLPVRLVDDAGRDVARSAISFISPSADPEMQTVLAKVPIEASSGFRTSQFVRAQVIWTTTPTLTVPVTAVLRINGQYFAFVAEGGVAHQRPVTLGTVLGNDYIVLDGLKAGETLIVSGVQKIGEGAPVTAAGSAAAPPGAPGTPAPARGARSGAPAPPGEAASPGETK
jgi:RND family efflux transporter MFP subunit